MKPLDFTSTVVASFIGAILLLFIAFIFLQKSDDESNSWIPLYLAIGSVVGAGVQTGVRISGVS